MRTNKLDENCNVPLEEREFDRGYNPNLWVEDSEYKTDLDVRYDEYLEMIKEYSDGNIEY